MSWLNKRTAFAVLAILCLASACTSSPKQKASDGSGSKKTSKSTADTSQSSSPNGSTCFAITNGIPVSPQTMPAVALLESDTESCTGTFVGSNVVLTASHCLADAQISGQRPPDHLEVKVGGPDGQATPVSAAYFPKWAGQGNAEPENDLAILVLPGTPAPAMVPIASIQAKVGDKFTIAGFGATNANDWDGVSNPDGQFHRGSNHILAFGGDTIISVGEADASPHSPVGENSVVGAGDSGGPLIIGRYLYGQPTFVAPATGEFLNGGDYYANLITPSSREQLLQEEQEGRVLSVEYHTDLTLPVYQTWLKNLVAQGIDIRFTATDNCH